MADKRQFNSQMMAKGLEASVSEDQAREMADNQGSRYLLLVQVHSGPKTIAEDGATRVQLIPDLVELVPAAHEGPIQNLMNALKAQRPEEAGQLAMQGLEAPDLDEAAAGVWDGNPDAPVEPTPEDKATEQAEANVVQFSGKG